MNDNAAKGLENARQAGQLRKDADVYKRSSSIGKRNNDSGLSSGSSSGPLTTSLFNRSISSGVNSSSTVNRDVEAKKRLNREKLIKNTIKVAEKIPVLNKYAKVAKMAEKVNSIKSKRSGLFGSLFGNNKKPTNAEIEDANAAEQKGEEYNPEDTQVRFTGGLEKREKMILIGVLGGILLSSVFLCIILVSAITGGAKESYLASNDNPSESDIESAYNKDEENNDSNSSDNSSSN